VRPVKVAFSSMRVLIAIGGFVAIVLVAVLVAGGDSGDDKAGLIDEIKKELVASGAPRPLTDCMVERLNTSLDNAEVERLYGNVESPLANPKVNKAAVRSGIGCARQLERTGEVSRAELLEFFKVLSGTGQRT
jgi:hypothetical protein